MNRIEKVILGLIIIVALVLRVWQIDKFPAGFNADEAAIGYNAYSLIHTFKDEYGEVLPLAFKSFGDYKPGLYFYFVVPFVFVFGLSEFAVRFPSALLGVGQVILIYFLARLFFKDKLTPLISSLFLAISPWAIHFSRGGWETNAATFFITLGVYLFIKWEREEKSKLFFGSLFGFLVSMYLYQSPRLVVPILLLILGAFYLRKILKLFRGVELKKSVISLVVLLVISIPLVLQFTSGGGSARFSGLSSFADPGPASRNNELRGEHENLSGTFTKLLHNKLTAYGPNFLGHYLDHFSADFLFINGDPLSRNRVPETGQFYLIQSIFLAIGLVFLVLHKVKEGIILIVWVLVAPLASSITYQTPHAVRALNMVIPTTMIMAFGLSIIINLTSKFKVKYLVYFVIIVALSFEFVHYIESFYVHYPKRYPLSWEYGFSEMVGKLGNYQGQFDKVVITDRYDQPYILTLFYLKYDPAKYQPQAVLTERDKFNFGTVRSFDKYEFRKIEKSELEQENNILFIGTEEEITDRAKVIDKVYFPDGTPAFVFAKYKKDE